MPLTEKDWLSELAALAARTSDDGMTVAEMAEAMGVTDREVRILLKVAQKDGRLVVGRRMAEGLDGRAYRVPVYSVTPRRSPASSPTDPRPRARSSKG